MADRYWVGGSGTWNTSSTTNWSASTGGGGGASVPTSVDNVIFDNASGAGAIAITVTGTVQFANFTNSRTAGNTLSFAGTGAMQCFGSFDDTNNTITSFVLGTLGLIFAGGVNATLRCSCTMGHKIDVQPAAGFSLTLLTNVTSTVGTTTLTSGTLVLNGFTLKVFTLQWTAGNLDMGSGIIQSTGGGVSASSSTGATFSVTTGYFLLTGSPSNNSLGFTASGTATHAYPLRIIAYSSTAFLTISLTTSGNKSYSDFQVDSPGTSGSHRILFTLIISPTMTIGTVGADRSRRIAIIHSSLNTTNTITNATSATFTNVDFSGVSIGPSNSLTFRTYTGCGDGGGGNNASITSTAVAAKTVYWNFTAGGSYNNNAYATSSGGAPALANWPLPQDTVIIDNVGLGSGNTIVIGNNESFYLYPGFDASSRTNSMTISDNGSSSTMFLCGPVYRLPAVVTVTQSISTYLRFCGVITNFQFLNSSTTTRAKGLETAFGCNLTLGATTYFKQVLLNSGTTNLNGFTLDCSEQFQAGTALYTRTINFGTGGVIAISNTATASCVFPTSGTTIQGTAPRKIRYTGSPTGITFTTGQNFPETQSLDIDVTGGSAVFSIQPTLTGVGSIDFTGSTCTFSGLAGTNTFNLYGSLTLATGMAVSLTSTNTYAFIGTSGTQTLTTNGIAVPFSLSKTAGSTLSLGGNVTQTSTSTFTHTLGTVNLNSFTLTTPQFITSNVNVRTLDTGTGNLICTGAGNAFNATTATNLTVTGTGTITLNPTGNATFAGGGGSYPTVAFTGATTSVFTVTGANTFTTFGNVAALRTITLPASTTQTVTNFNLGGTAGNLTTLNSSVAGTQATISKASGTVTVSYLSIRDSNATGGATWNAFNGTNTNVSNNTGWLFTAVVFLAAAFFNFF